MITSDHGEELFDRGHVRHGYTLFNEVLRVPLIMLVPSQESAVFHRRVQLLGIVPTLAELLGIPSAGYQMQGSSLLGEGDGVVIAEAFRQHEVAYADSRAIIVGDLKLIQDNTEDRIWLFNLSSDPHEKNNLCPLMPELCNNLLDLLKSTWSSLQKPKCNVGVNLTEATRERLEGIGLPRIVENYLLMHYFLLNCGEREGRAL